MEKNCRFGSSLASSAILLMSVHLMFRVLSLVMSPFNRFVRLLPPSLQRVPWPPPFGSPAVPRLPRYYGVVRLLRHPSAVLWGCKTAPPSSRAPSGRPSGARPSRHRPLALGVGGDGELS